MKICAAPLTTLPKRHVGRWANAESSHAGKTALLEADGDGRSLRKATPRTRDPRPELRRALRPAGGLPLDVAGEPGPDAPSEEVQTRSGALRRGHQLPL